MKKLLLLVIGLYLSSICAAPGFDNAVDFAIACHKASLHSMDFSILSNGNMEALAELSLKTKQIVEDIATQNPKATGFVLGTGVLSVVAYKGVNYIANIDPKTAGSTALMGYGALRILIDAKNVLKGLLSAVEQEESKIRAEVIMDEFYEIQSAAEEIEANKNKCSMTPEKEKGYISPTSR